jgi:copper homeostasis protein
VFGILKPDGSVDVERTGELVRLARPLQVPCGHHTCHMIQRVYVVCDVSYPGQVTFHRAFDMAKDHLQAMEDIISLGTRSPSI